MKAKRIGVIMAGGMGERFWPCTDPSLPKYAIEFEKGTTFLEKTFDRLEPFFGAENLYVITVQEHCALVKRLLKRLPASHVLGEPERRNTAAAVTLTSLWLKKQFGPDMTMAFFPADALILHEERFRTVLGKAFDAAEKRNETVVLGIPPSRPATGYGYIEAGKGSSVVSVKRFHEKPDLATAKKYLKSGKYFWNAGIFVWKALVFDVAIQKHASDFYSYFSKASLKNIDSDEVRKLYGSVPKNSIDKELIEKLPKLAMVRADVGWDDIGSWEALRRMGSDAKGNVLLSDAHVLDVENSVIRFDAGKKVAVAGLKDVIVIQRGDETLVCHRDWAEKVKDLRTLVQAPMKKGKR